MNVKDVCEVQFCAAQDKVRFWIQLDSIVEQFTVVPTFVSIYYNRNWLGSYRPCFEVSCSLLP